MSESEPTNPYAAPVSELKVDDSPSAVKTAVIQWEKFRLIFNAVLLFEGLFFVGQLMLLEPALVIAAAAFGIAANVCFCLGPLIEMYTIAFRGEAFSKAARGALFAVGFGFSMLVVGALGIQANYFAWALT